MSTPAAVAAPPPASLPHRLFPKLTLPIHRIEDGLAVAAILLMAALPVLEIVLRSAFHTGIPGSTAVVQHLTLWVGFLGAMLASREKRHLGIAVSAEHLPVRVRRAAGWTTNAVSAAVCVALAHASWEFVRSEMEGVGRIGGVIPLWTAQLILPAAFAVMALRFVLQTEGWIGRSVALLGPLAVWPLLLTALEPYAGRMLWPGIAVLLAAAAVGAPIFVAFGGCALLLFYAEGTLVSAVPLEAYRLVVDPAIPTIPLFTLTGFILAEGNASQRLLRLFQGLFGWIPGGLAIVATLVCAFFTTFTGASGVTILALGGVLLPMLVRSGYRETFSIGLLTSSGSIGLLLPPSLPLILYAIVARVPIPDLFRAAAIPGVILVLAVAVFGVFEARRSAVPRQRFAGRAALAAVRDAKWEVLLPVVALVALFGGFCTMVEAAAITALYTLVVQAAIHRELHPLRDLPRVFVKAVALVGGVIAILGAAMGLTNYLVYAEVPMQAAAWVEGHIHSVFLFLLILNLFLIVVGALMDIFSAIMVVVPLILPASAAFGIEPLHLGVIFLANLELGYLMPPVGENLFLASYRFEKPLLRVAAYTVPFVLAILGAVLVITYVPGLALLGAR